MQDEVSVDHARFFLLVRDDAADEVGMRVAKVRHEIVQGCLRGRVTRNYSTTEDSGIFYLVQLCDCLEHATTLLFASWRKTRG